MNRKRTKHMLLLAFFIFAGAGGVSVSCSRRPPKADNLLIICCDTTRADHLSIYGYPEPTSPNLESLAKKGVRFERAFTSVPSTLPAHSSLFTGLLPPLHGVRANGKFQLAEKQFTLAEILRHRKFATAAIIGGFPLDSCFGISQGFEVYDDDFSSSTLTAQRRKKKESQSITWLGHDLLDFERNAEEVTNRAIQWLKEKKEGKTRWFLFVHYFDPHFPYQPPAEWTGKFDSPYDAEIAYADHQLGRLLEFVDRLPGRTLTVFISDHGESLGEHGEKFHNRFLYNSTLHIPMVIALEDYAPPISRTTVNTGLIDILPTVLELLSIDAPSGLSGRSLAAVLCGEHEPENRPLYGETLAPFFEDNEKVEVRSIIDEDFKLIHTLYLNKEKQEEFLELYNTKIDPAETKNRAELDAGVTNRLKNQLKEWQKRLNRQGSPLKLYKPDEGTRQRLKSLGYL